MQYRSTSARAVIMRDRRILVEWIAEKSMAFLPGGRVEAGESLAEALRRELAEEIGGADLAIGRYRGRIGHLWNAGAQADSCLNHFFEVEIVADQGVAAKEPGRELWWLGLDSKEAGQLKPPSLLRLLASPEASEWNAVDTE